MLQRIFTPTLKMEAAFSLPSQSLNRKPVAYAVFDVVRDLHKSRPFPSPAVPAITLVPLCPRIGDIAQKLRTPLAALRKANYEPRGRYKPGVRFYNLLSYDDGFQRRGALWRR